MNTSNNNSSEEKTITLADLWRVFLTALPLMIIAAVLIVGIGYAYRSLTYRPKYTSEGAFLVLRDTSQTGENTMSTGSEAQYAKLMLQTCYHLVNSDDVVADTVDKLAAEGSVYTVKQIKSAVKVQTSTDVLIMDAYATARTPEEAQKILTAFMTAAEEYVEDYLAGLMHISSPARLPASPSTSFGALRILLVGFLGAVIVYAVYLVMNLIDDRVRTGDDITDVAGLTLLGIIPDAHSTSRKYAYKYGRKYAKHYGRYGAHGTQKQKED